jgi:hypothetical protein
MDGFTSGATAHTSHVPHIAPATQSIASMAREALDSTEGDVASATRIVVDMLLGDSDLLRSVIGAAVQDVAHYHVTDKMRKDRAKIFSAAVKRAEVPVRPVGAPSVGSRGSVIALAAVIKDSILDMSIARGLKLRDATREEALKHAGFLASMSKDMALKVRFLGKIVEIVPPGKKVGESVTDERAEALFREAKNGHA